MNDKQQLEKNLAKLKLENQRLLGDFNKLTPEQMEDQNRFDLKELAHFYGGWDELQKVINQLRENDNEAAAERRNGDAWAGGIADNH